MSKAVRFDDYGGVEVLEVREVVRPEPGPGQVLVAVRAAGINPSEAKMRAGSPRVERRAGVREPALLDRGHRRVCVVRREDRVHPPH